MLPEIGHFSLILSLCLYLCLAIVPLAGVSRGNSLLMVSSRALAVGGSVFIAISFLCLVQSFLQDDFSVAYVANNSNTLLPNPYKVSAVWAGHEGSLLLWVLILSLWTLAVSMFSRHLPIDMLARVLSVMGMIAIGFLLFILLTSNPFDRILPFAPVEGSDLNPLLQDPGLIFHPPMLYMGYVGFAVAFAFAVAALLSGHLDSAWARWSRPWTTIAWVFLTFGIALGSWWAYYELGWGGWWFWDPVENASFMPWLIGTALIHSLAVTEKRGIFKSWTILLAISTFSLSLLGTFLVRSGVLTSVHTFAADPDRGIFILLFLLIVAGGSLLLYALRAPEVKSQVSFQWLSREVFLLGNNIILAIVMLCVLVATLLPLIVSIWGLKISVGPPVFNGFFIPFMGVLCVLMGVGPLTSWKNSRRDNLVAFLKRPLILSVLAGLAFPWFYGETYSPFAAMAVAVAMWIVLTLVVDMRYKIRHADTIFSGLRRLARSYYGMVLAHVGVAVTVLGVCLNTIYSERKDVRMQEGETIAMGRHQYHLVSIRTIHGPNYIAQQGQIDVYHDQQQISRLLPEKRRYLSGGNMMTEAGIDSGFWGDTYVALGQFLEKNDQGQQVWAVRLHHKPFVNWIWLGALLMGLGGVLAMSDKRYRLGKKTLDSHQPVIEGSV